MKFQSLKDKLHKFFSGVLEVLFPSKIKCMFCGREIFDYEKQPYCDSCAKSAPFNNAKRCKICDCEMYDDGEICDGCKDYAKHFDKAVAPMKYEGVAKTLVLKLKNDNALYLADDMARLMSERLNQESFNFDVIVPVPLSPKSLKARKYNQAKLLADALGKIFDKPVDKSVLIKIKETKHQKNLNISQRKNNLHGAFKIQNKRAVFGKNVLLVDDVVTTGATANECSSLLKKYAKRVWVVCFARNPLKNK